MVQREREIQPPMKPLTHQVLRFQWFNKGHGFLKVHEPDIGSIKEGGKKQCHISMQYREL